MHNWNEDNGKIQRIKIYAVRPLLLYLAAIFLVSLFSVFVGYGVFANIVVHYFILLLGLPAAAALAVALVIMFGGDADSSGRIEVSIFDWFIYAGPGTQVIICLVIFLAVAAVLMLFLSLS